MTLGGRNWAACVNCRSLTETDRDVAEAECMAEAVKPRRAKAKVSRTKGKVRMPSLPCEPSARRASRGVPWRPVGSRGVPWRPVASGCQGCLAVSLS